MFSIQMAPAITSHFRVTKCTSASSLQFERGDLVIRKSSNIFEQIMMNIVIQLSEYLV
jgi:hypothetical protein